MLLTGLTVNNAIMFISLCHQRSVFCPVQFWLRNVSSTFSDHNCIWSYCKAARWTAGSSRSNTEGIEVFSIETRETILYYSHDTLSHFSTTSCQSPRLVSTIHQSTSVPKGLYQDTLTSLPSLQEPS